jgi:hypothetical protein
MESSSPSRSGTTCRPSTGDRGEEGSTSSQEASRARTFPPQAKARESTENKVVSGQNLPASLAKFDPATSSWKTHQCSLFGGLEEFSGTWPRWGMMRAGECWEQTMPGHLISASESGLLLPTPSATSYGTNQGGRMGRVGPVRPSLQTMARQNFWPTPCTPNGGRVNRQEDIANKGSRADGRKVQVSLESAVKWNTPTARDANSLKKVMRGKGSLEKGNEIIQPLPVQVGGSLNPTWVEWLMGWPLGWTSLEPLEMDKFQQWLHSHGGF